MLIESDVLHDVLVLTCVVGGAQDTLKRSFWCVLPFSTLPHRSVQLSGCTDYT